MSALSLSGLRQRCSTSDYVPLCGMAHHLIYVLIYLLCTRLCVLRSGLFNAIANTVFDNI